MQLVESSDLLSSCRQMLLRHRRRMLLFFLIVMGATLIGTALSPRTYRSQAKLLVRLGRENATLDPTATLGQGHVIALPNTRENEVNSVLEMILSRALLEQVVDAVGPRAILGDDPPPGRDDPPAPPIEEPQRGITVRYKAVQALARSLKVEVVRKSNVVVVTLDGPSPELCETTLARLVDFYLDRHIRHYRTPGAARFLSEQATRLHTQLTRTEDQLRDLKNETGLISPEAQRQALVARVSRLEDELLQADAAALAAEAEVKALRDKLASLPSTQVTAKTTGNPNHATDLMQGQLYALQLKEKDLLARYPENHPEVKLVQRQVAAAKALLTNEPRQREQITTGPSKLYEEAELARQRQEAQLASLRGRAQALRKQLDEERAALKKFNANELRISRLQRKLDLEGSHYRRYAENAEQGQIDHALQAERMSNISLVQPPTYDPKPIRPRLLVNFGLGFVLAITGSVGLAVLAESRARSRPMIGATDQLASPVATATAQRNGAEVVS